MADLTIIEEGIKALKEKTEGEGLSSAEVINLLKDETVELKGITHTGSFNPFSYTVTEAMVAVMEKRGANPETLRNIRGWKIEVPKKDIGSFWAITERLRKYAKSRVISGTTHFRNKELSEFLKKAEEGKELWEAEKALLETKFDNLKESYYKAAEESLKTFFEEDEVLANEVLKDLKAKTIGKEEYLKRLNLIISLSKPSKSFAFFKSEDARKIEELASESTRLEVLKMFQACLDNIVLEVSNLYRKLDSGDVCSKNITQFEKAVRRANGDNLFANPALQSVCDIMADILNSTKGNDFATAQADAEDLFKLIYQLEAGIEGVDLDWSYCPVPKSALAS